MSAVFGQSRADLIERSRNFSYLALMALCLFGAFWFVPREVDGFEIMALQPDIFIQGGNPGWIPVTSAIGLAFFLPFIGFFYLKNAVAYDERMGIEQLITSSTTGNLRYLIGKFISGALLMFSFAIAVMIGSFFMMLWHFPGQFISLYAFLSPYIFILASIPLCSAVAVFFSSNRFLRGTIGSVIYVIGVFVVIVYSTEAVNAGLILRSLDVTALSSLMEIVSRTAYEQTGFTIDSVLFIGGYVPDASVRPAQQLFFNGLNFNSTDFAVFGSTLLIAAGFVLLSAPLYSLTKKLPKKLHIRKSIKQAGSEIEFEQKLKPLYSAVSPSHRNMWVRGIGAEIKLMLKGQPLIWCLVSISGVVLSLFLEMNIVLTLVLPLLMLWMVNVFSRLGNREHKHDTLKIIATIPGGKLRQITYSLVAGLFIALLLALPVIIRMALAGQFVGVFAVLSGVMFLPSFAMFLGEFTKTGRLFEIIFILLTYAIVNGVPVAMYMGCYISPSVIQAGVYLLAGIVFGIAAILKRHAFT